VLPATALALSEDSVSGRKRDRRGGSCTGDFCAKQHMRMLSH